MRMLSYRGPDAPGGVSNALTQLFAKDGGKSEWWYFVDADLRRQTLTQTEHAISAVTELLKVNHYRYCNNYLWPLLHDLPQFAHFDELEHQSYRSLNAHVAARLRENPTDDELFVNDYQFALIPHFVAADKRCAVFWHIPWPQQVQEEHVTALAEIAVGLLGSSNLGFHTQEYSNNFLAFVETHLSQYQVDFGNSCVNSKFAKSNSAPPTKVLVAPLGLDLNGWNSLSRLRAASEQRQQCPFILSIDRCDYTKGIIERLDAIDSFYEHYPQWRTKVCFLQLGTRSRQGLPEFDRYWRRCRERAAAINNRWSTKQWNAVVWVDEPACHEDLAALYSQAEVMLVTPVRDGLNLTAKEFVACQHAAPGVLAISQNAGVWHEFKDGSVTVDISDSRKFAETIADCLEMNETERYRRNHILKERLRGNTLESWWAKFLDSCSSSATIEPRKKIG
ncbi:MAG: trehalose-6-phosphate synthase [Cyanobacteria bacterium SZAS-4]|nr:trehalose-6-phosphate synthase [Cyanobacteria bacterium SZAS-4]